MALATLPLLAAESAQFESCYARWDGAKLTIGNAYVERQWQAQGGRLFATSFRDVSARTEWLAGRAQHPAPYPKFPGAEAERKLTFASRTGAASAVEAGSLIVELKSESAPAVTYRFQVFPESRGISVQLVAGAGGGSVPAKSPDQADTVEELDVAAEHTRLTQVTLLDQTDVHNELVFEKEWLLSTAEGALRLEGNLFVLENTLTKAGLVLLKMAPLPHARPVHDEWDLEAGMRGRLTRLTLSGHGLDPTGGAGYASVVLAYSGGVAGRTEAIQGWQRQLRRFDPARDARFLSNTWGDRSRDARINAEFMKSEIAAGAKLGVDVIQIDDGWQKGRTSNSARGPGVWNGYWSQDAHFWDADAARFPGGLAPLVKLAAGQGMRFGLWFGPDSSGDFANWERDAGRILQLHREDGIDYFKIDSVKAVSKAGERNLRRLFDRVLTESKGKVVFDLDVTAEIRPGYFGLCDVGPIFLENRYTDFHRYWPHQTLRNLWKLAHYIDPARLRMEVLNNTRNAAQYADDPLAPARYSPEWLFASVMFASPLGWFETSNLPEAYVAGMSGMAKAWKARRADLFRGTILPVGEAPDGTNWSGFASYAADRATGYLLLFRGVNETAEWHGEVPPFRSGSYSVEVLGGKGTVTVEGGVVRARVEQSPGFVWVGLKRGN